MTTTFTPIDLSRLPAPVVVEQIDYEAILAERKAYAVSLWPTDQQAEVASTLALESEPLTKLIQENAYRETLLRQRINEAALAVLLPFAQGADLEQIGARFNVERLTITPAAPSAVPPVAAVLEDYESLRERIQMAMEGLSTAGPRNAYIFHARSADGRVADASAISPAPAEVVVTVQSALGDGTAAADLLAMVAAYLSDEDRRPVADRLTVQSAEVLPYTVEAVLYLNSSGPESEPVRAAAEARLAALVNARRRLGQEVNRSALDAALHIEGVKRVELPGWSDVVASLTQAPNCTAYSVTVAE
ncbi:MULTISPECIES: baseplate J/gp47 family protein [unclassified Pseudomonas]|jgi:phage-related baseplate assembly protein|uniref:baseplate J/gp47 family protein n=1 Tax=unclassified Pseudomonas TaxID=196821 RepID=UPI00035720B7|nr:MULTISPECIES: baseplate J/gp47 family protein [unclassified Pseudomonas]OKP74037.1 baseplate assembly protein [Pseudomonas fluorescens]EPJ83236.1 J protein [Pseudomonas sp. CFT9]PMX16191.1 baseplate assembly protein [Pseudomonas sp. MPBC4-3]PMX49025.1 baseplate assembly protein [Pseudomonas sp. FW301-21B01]PMY08057.1 baseplate assembly protein [Pseudomonas sp. MPR-R5A]